MSALDQLLIKAYQQDLPATDRVPAPHLRVAKHAEKAAVAAKSETAHDRNAHDEAVHDAVNGATENSAEEAVEEVVEAIKADTKPSESSDLELYVGASNEGVGPTTAEIVGAGNSVGNIVASTTKTETGKATTKRSEPELIKPTNSTPSQTDSVANPSIDRQPVEPNQDTTAAVEETAKSQPRAKKTKEFKPAWEVDRFGWTEICKTISDDLQNDLDEFSKTLPKGRSAFLMVGTVEGAGCTTTTLCIAKHLAGQGKKLAIIDADFTDRGLTRSLKVNVDAGIETVLAGISELEDIAIRSLEDQIVLVPGNAAIDLSGGQALNRLADIAIKLNPFFDVVLIDAGVEVCNEICERRKPFPAKAIIVNRSEGEDRKPVDATTTMLRDANFSIFGIVENFIGKEG